MSAPSISRRASLAITLALACLLGAAPLAAHASYGACRSDPYLLLSNGTQLDLSATIQDSASDVVSTTYLVVGPAGTTVVAAARTDSLLGMTEHFEYVATNPAGQYDTYTTVVTGKGGIGVTASDVLVGLVKVASPSVSGTSGETLHATV